MKVMSFGVFFGSEQKPNRCVMFSRAALRRSARRSLLFAKFFVLNIFCHLCIFRRETLRLDVSLNCCGF